MPGGRPRKPTSAKILDGTFRADRDGPADSVVPAPGSPVAPASLQGEALAFWNQIVPDLVARGVAAACDAPTLGYLCEWWSLYRRLYDSLPPEGSLAGCTQTITQMAIATDKFDRLASKYGLNPSDRAKLRIAPAKDSGSGKKRPYKIRG